jgi:hypothetical protein
MKEVDPEGVQLRKRRSLHRRTYVSPGPNFAWHADMATINSNPMVFQSTDASMALAG